MSSLSVDEPIKGIFHLWYCFLCMSFAFNTFSIFSLSPESSHLSCMLSTFPFNMLIIVKVPDSCNIWVILESGSISYFIPWQFFSWIFVWFIILHYMLNMSRRTESLRQISFMLENGHIYSSFRLSVCVSEWQKVEVESVNRVEVGFGFVVAVVTFSAP